MLADTAFSFAQASTSQIIAIAGSVIAHLGFFAWLAVLAIRK